MIEGVLVPKRVGARTELVLVGASVVFPPPRFVGPGLTPRLGAKDVIAPPGFVGRIVWLEIVGGRVNVPCIVLGIEDGEGLTVFETTETRILPEQVVSSRQPCHMVYAWQASLVGTVNVRDGHSLKRPGQPSSLEPTCTPTADQRRMYGSPVQRTGEPLEGQPLSVIV